METPNYIALMSDSIDGLGKSFTASTYGAFASQIAPVLSGLLVLYMIFWGFRFWQGKGESSVTQIAFRLFRIAVIFSIATGWGPIQTVLYRVITDIPSSVSSVMMNNIVNVGRGSMSQGTVERDLYVFTGSRCWHRPRYPANDQPSQNMPSQLYPGNLPPIRPLQRLLHQRHRLLTAAQPRHRKSGAHRSIRPSSGSRQPCLWDMRFS